VNSNSVYAINYAIDAGKLLKERSEIYDSNEINVYSHTKIMQILYPKGIPVSTEEMTRYKYLSQIVDKILRYRINKKEDNIIDMANYGFLLLAMDKEFR